MCGIAGYYHKNGNFSFTKDVIRSTASCLIHRGPDGEGAFINNNVAFVHRRLSIIDLETGQQPMKNQDGSVVITYNGEIYNYIELREILRSKGYSFISKSDTEVILQAYSEWGLSCLDQLNGMFAFAIWDDRKKQLFLARDRLGIKPLYYYWDGKLFAFASEIQAVAMLIKSRLSIDPTALAFYSTLGYIPAPYTIYKEIRKLEPAHYILLKEGRLSKKRYWNVDFSHKERRPLNTLLQEIPEKLEKAVTSQMVSDVPLGAFLSGGIDSSAVVAMMCQTVPERVNTFSIGFPEKAFDESPFARIVAERYGTEHREFQVTLDAMDVLPALVKHFGEPFADSSALPTWYLSKMTRQHVTVALSGDGGDELFCGYTVYLGHQLSQLYRLLPKTLRHLILKTVRKIRFSEHDETNRILSVVQKRLEDAELDQVKRVYSKNCMFNEEFAKDISEEMDKGAVEALFAHLLKSANAESFLDAIAYLQLNLSLPDDMLTKVDRMSMAHSLEVRVPFLDHEFVEYVATIPASMRFRFWKTKWLLRKAMEPYLPHSILWRKKQGFSVPLYYWFRSNNNGASFRSHKSDQRDSSAVWGKMILKEWKDQTGNQKKMGVQV